MSHRGQWCWNLNSKQKFITWGKSMVNRDYGATTMGNKSLHCQWYPNHLGNSRRILINQNILFYPMSWKNIYFSGYRHFAVYFNLSGPTLIFFPPQVLFTSLSIFSAPHSHFYSRLITLLFFRLPWSDIDGHERGMRSEKIHSSCPHF